MKIIITGTEYDFDEDSLTNREAMEIEKVTGGTFSQFSDALKNGSMLALTALVWTMMRRTETSLRFNDVEFAFGDLEVIDDTEDAKASADPSAPV